MAERKWNSPRLVISRTGDIQATRRLERKARVLVGYLFDQLRGEQTYRTQTWQLQDGSKIQIFVWSDLLNKRALARIYGAPVIVTGGEPIDYLYESGLYTPSYTPKRVYVGNSLESWFLEEGVWQGNFTCGGTETFPISGEYYTTAKTQEAQSLHQQYIPTMFTGLARLLVQSKLGADTDPDTCAMDPSGFLKYNSFSGLYSGNTYGIIQEPPDPSTGEAGAYWIADISQSSGVRVRKLVCTSPCDSADTSAQRAEFRVSALLASAVLDPSTTTTELMTSTEVADLFPSESQVFGHGWHFRRQTIADESIASIVIVEKSEDVSNGSVDVYNGHIWSIRFQWGYNALAEEWEVEATATEDLVGDTVRMWHGGTPLWYPVRDLNAYTFWYTDPPYATSLIYEPYQDQNTPVYCFYDKHGELEILRYKQWFIKTNVSLNTALNCQEKVSFYGFGTGRKHTGGFFTQTIRNTTDLSIPNDTQRLYWRGTKSITNSIASTKFADMPRSTWYILGGSMVSEALSNFYFQSDEGYFEHWGIGSTKIFIYGYSTYGHLEYDIRGCVIPFSDAEAVYLCKEGGATWSTLKEWEHERISAIGATFYLNGGETKIFKKLPVTNEKGEQSRSIGWKSIYSKAHTSPYTCCGGTPTEIGFVSGGCFPSSPESGTLVRNLTNAPDYHTEGAIVTSTGFKEWEVPNGSFDSYLTGLSDQNLYRGREIDAISAYNYGGVFTKNPFTGDQDSLDFYDASAIAIQQSRFIGAA